MSTTVTAATASPSSTSIRVTPWVGRPWTEICSTGVRSTIPPSEMSISSCLGLTIRADTKPPVLGLVLKVMTPCPLRPCSGYSPTGVRLPNPWEVTTSIASLALAISSATTRSPLASLTPRTPPDWRDAERRERTGKRRLLPWAVTSMAWSSSLAILTETSSSCASRSIALSPPRRTLAKCFSGVFFTSPSLVPITR